MAKKQISKKLDRNYLFERIEFSGKTVLKNLTKNELGDIFEILDADDQLKIFSTSETTIDLLTDVQIDSLFPYAPALAPKSVEFMDLTREEKLKLLRENKDTLIPVLEKKGLTEAFDLDEKKVITKELYKSSLLWDIIKTGKYNFTEGKKNYD